MTTDQISPRQLMIIVILYAIGTAILVIPASVAADAKQDAWMPQIVSIAMGIVLVWLYVFISKKFPQCSIYEINDKVFGKWLGKFITLSLALLTLIFSSQVVFYVGQFMTTQIIQETPIQSIHILFMLLVVMGAKLGMVVLLRTAEIFFPWIVLLFILFMVINIPNMELNNILPVGEITTLPVVRSAIRITSYTYISLFITIGPIIHQVTSMQKAKKAYLIGVIISGMMMLLLILSSVLVLGADNTAVQVYPSYALAQRINIGNFLQRIEVIVAFLWLVSIFFKLSMFFNTAIRGIAHVFHFRDYKMLCFPLGLIDTVLSLVVYPNTAYEDKFDNLTFIPLALLIGFVYPLLIVLISWMRKSSIRS
ncbi:endospore germination permease [Paenibacillus alginolyticus]|uniref:GerAB/ArcD/ProY family transporter n=1 Tax=Paenibacillus alginolyticus TaxID=59839 RepID=UPI00040C17A7|nr:endospore germination permease [Paenibacillus alginolyticus]MCY9669650.1 endospore germination permease [Paenibacillus alginolyticus]